jgi:hypothetical protein
MPGQPEEIEEELRDLLSRRLPDETWAEVDQALRTMADALAAGDDDAVQRQRDELDSFGARRISRGVNPAMGKPDLRPAGQTTAELVNHIVAHLTPPLPKPPAPGSPKK